ncbi:hypothetical protein SAY87_026790 [Trapa incisa]|uniref:Uncharacterized protein n=1 Tax=Trapa incisa TaxID=236973 RepID=A0AAN7GQT0_9MYRT|nr:hypothetical protein SAY87_026790 [Trapa incisa]
MICFVHIKTPKWSCFCITKYDEIILVQENLLTSRDSRIEKGNLQSKWSLGDSSTFLRPWLLLLLLEECKERDTRDLHNLEPNSRNISHSMALPTKSSNQYLILSSEEKKHNQSGEERRTMPLAWEEPANGFFHSFPRLDFL